MNQWINDEITNIIWEVLQELYDCKKTEIVKDDIQLQLPKNTNFGDIATNTAFRISRKVGQRPDELAKSISASLNQEKYLQRKIYTNTEMAGKGFINFFLGERVLERLLTDILDEGTNYGKSDYGQGKKVLIEFVSANPTGPLTLAHGRQAAIGDVLANIFSATGFHLTREYYLNDRGIQMKKLANSVYARYCEELGEKIVFPDDGYQGDYISDIAREYLKDKGKKIATAEEAKRAKNPEAKKEEEEKLLAEIQDFAYNYIMNMILADLNDFGVVFGNIFSEEKFTRSGKVEKCLEQLNAKGFVYSSEGARWFKSTQFGDDKDRVLIKKNGEMTYITPDIAYHRDKYDRGYDLLINLWGPDHHGYIPRMRAAIQALGHNQDSLKVLIVQLCTLYEGKKKLSMSTRKGEFISLRKIMNTVGKDAARFFFNSRKTDSHLAFDLDLAKKKSSDNPVYYIQYAHARICSVYNKLAENGYNREHFQIANISWEKSFSEEESNLIKLLGRFPDVLISSTEFFEPSKLTDYIYDVAQAFHQFYNRHRIITQNRSLTEARVLLIEGVQTVLQNGLKILGIRAPEKM